jgi:hypothetical protein
MNKVAILVIIIITALSYANKLFGADKCSCDDLAICLNLLEVTNNQLNKIVTESPTLKITEPSTIIIDNDDRIYINEKASGILTIGELQYKIDFNLHPTIVKKRPSKYQFHLKPKAFLLYEFDLKTIQGEGTPGLGVEVFQMYPYNLNVLSTTKTFAVVTGFNITNHFNILSGVGRSYHSNWRLLFGGSFDF